MSNINDPIFMEGDEVFYVGTKFKSELSGKEGKPHVGVIYARIQNQMDVFCVEFSDTKSGDSYVLPARSLSKYRPSKTEVKYEGPEVQRKRKRSEDE